MKALKIIGVIVIALVLIVVVLGLIAPTHTHVERTATIEAPADMVWANINTFAGMQKWSPWAELDPDQELSISENDGEVGATMSWSGDENVGSGEQTITGLEEGTSMTTHLHFITPFEGEADATVSVSEENGVSSATWAYDADSPFPMNAMNLFMDMDDMLGPDFQKGVDKLKAIVESEKTNKNEFGGFTIMEDEITARTVIGTRDTIGWDEFQGFYQENFPKAYGAIAEAELELVGSPVGVFFMWDGENQRTDILAGGGVASGSIDGMNSAELGGKALVIDFYGPYEETGKAHEAMDEYMKWHEIEMKGPVVEEYVTDPMTEPDPAKWLTKVYYPI